MTAPAAARPLTAEGTLVGTFQYMSPEQLEGRHADARSDIFAFGGVLYEMATGKKAFEGKSQASVIAAILEHHPPSISSVQPMVPPAFDHVVKTCLAKDPDARWQSAHDVELHLKWIAGGGSLSGVPTLIATQRKRSQIAAWGLAAIFLLTTLAAGAIWFLRAPQPLAVVRFQIPSPEITTRRSIALSPDGRRIAFIAPGTAGQTMLWVRALDSLEARPLPGTENASQPFWSPDGGYLAFFAGVTLKKVEVSGGPPQTLWSGASFRGGSWSRDGVILLRGSGGGGLARVSQDGGEVTPLTTPDSDHGEHWHGYPQFLPDGRHFIYFAFAAQGNSGIYLGTLDGKEKKQIQRTSFTAAYVPPSTSEKAGRLLFLRGGTLMAQQLDPRSFDPAGDAVPVVQGVGSYGVEAFFAVSENGVVV